MTLRNSLNSSGLAFPHQQDESQRKRRQRCHHQLVGLQPKPRVTAHGHQQSQAGARLTPSAGRDHPASVPAGARVPYITGERHKVRPRWVSITQRKGVSTTSPRPRFLGSWTKSSAHLRPDSPAGTSPSLRASVAILVSKLLSPPPR